MHVVGDGLHAGGAHDDPELLHRDGAFAVLGEDREGLLELFDLLLSQSNGLADHSCAEAAFKSIF